jgi:hypothetical protein
MVKLDTDSASRPAEAYAAYRGPPTTADLRIRKISSVALIILLFTAAVPFSPVSWVLQVEGAYLFDRLVAGIILGCACYFQWSIADRKTAVFLRLPSPSAEGRSIRNGRLEQEAGEVIFMWHPSTYWLYATCEALMLCVAEWGPSEMLRRVIVAGVVGFLWALGWVTTPQSTKIWAWGHIKAFWFWIVLDEIMGIGRRGAQRRYRRF